MTTTTELKKLLFSMILKTPIWLVHLAANQSSVMSIPTLGGRVRVVRCAAKRNHAVPHFYERYFGHTKLSTIWLVLIRSP